MAKQKPSQIGSYRIVREIGRGGMGTVYEAEHLRVKSRVAIKVLHPEYSKDPQIVARFRQEPMAANLTRHPGIAHVIESDVMTDGTPFIVMEYLDGQSLRQRLKRARSGLPEIAVVRFGKQVADALAAAHGKKIVHRDIKPENIMIVRDDAVPGGERAKVLDFGIARVAEEHVISTSQSLTQVQTSPFAALLGTATYMAPEQCQGIGRSIVGETADVYSLGVMMYEMLAARPPFQAPELVSVMHMHVSEAPTPVSALRPDVSPDIDALIMRMLAKDPEQRPSMRDVSAALTELEPMLELSLHEGSPSLPGRITPPSVKPHPAQRVRLWTALLLLAGALVIAGVVYLFVLPPSASVRWRISSQPSEAEIVDPQGQVIGKTPAVLVRSRDIGRFEVTLRLPGYQPERLVLDYSEDSERRVTLSPEARR
ncbi:MAG: serine/threonine-protein kinase [Polyangia bacterium]